MNTANLELCQELHELSGWIDPGAGGWSHVPGAPYYTLGFLLRKLPETAPVYDDIGSLELYKASGSWGIWYCVVDDYGNYDTEANTPEDAAAKLAIELFKQGILTRSEK